MMTRWTRNLAVLLAVVGGLAFHGCGTRQAASVEGTLVLDGKPLTDADVTFHPLGIGTIAYGHSDREGHYVLHTGRQQGLSPGQYRVTVVASRIENASSAEEPLPKLLTPVGYSIPEQTPLRADVVPGKNHVDLTLERSATP